MKPPVTVDNKDLENEGTPKTSKRDDDVDVVAADGAVRLVIRACLICEWQGEIVERPPADAPGCPWCHGPTDLVRVVQGPDATPGEKNPHAAALGRLGGLKGGYARAAVLSAKERCAIATKASRARWKKSTKPDMPQK